MTVRAAYSLRRRLWLSSLIINICFWFVALGSVAYTNWEIASRMMERGLAESGRLILAASQNLQERGLMPRDDEYPDSEEQRNLDDDLFLSLENEPAFARLSNRVQVQIVMNGKVLVRTPLAPRQPYAEHFQGESGYTTVSVEGRQGKRDWRVFVIKSPQYNYEVQVARMVRQYVPDLLRVGIKILPWAIAFLIVFSVISLWITYKLMKPLNDVTAEVTQKSSTNLKPLTVTELPKEVVPLVVSLNDLLARLERSLESERRFTADAAHELRTPLSALSMKAQLLKRQHPDAAQDFALFTNDINRTTALIEQLLMLARLDPLRENGALQAEEVQLADLVDEIILQHQHAAEQQRMQLLNKVAPDLRASLNQDLLRIALHNLIDNSMKYGNEGGRIEVSAQHDAEGLTISVADNGPGVDPGFYEQLSHRFFRVLGTGKTGSGLGLSIVERVAELHNGKLCFAGGLDGKGLKVSLVLGKQETVA